MAKHDTLRPIIAIILATALLATIFFFSNPTRINNGHIDYDVDTKYLGTGRFELTIPLQIDTGTLLCLHDNKWQVGPSTKTVTKTYDVSTKIEYAIQQQLGGYASWSIKTAYFEKLDVTIYVDHSHGLILSGRTTYSVHIEVEDYSISIDGGVSRDTTIQKTYEPKIFINTTTISVYVEASLQCDWACGDSDSVLTAEATIFVTYVVEAVVSV